MGAKTRVGLIRELVSFGGGVSRAERSIAPKPSCTKYFGKLFRKETGLDKSHNYIFTNRKRTEPIE